MDYKKNALVNEYVTEAPAELAGAMQSIRNLIFEQAPEAKEMMNEQAPSYEFNGLQLASFSYGKDQVDFHIDASALERQRQAFPGQSGFQVKPNEPLPLDSMRDSLAQKVRMIKDATEAEVK